MKTKLEIAHEWYMKHSESPSFMYTEVEQAWQYADAMQAAADERSKKHHDFVPAIMEGIKNAELEEWQPDWSQAPDVATYWTMRQDGKCLWWKGKPLFDGSCFYDAVGICHTVGYAPSFGYTGDWRESLRKRPK